MSHTTLERHLKKNTVKPVYLWFGEEEFLIRQALARLEEWLQQHAEDAAKTVFEAADTPLPEVLTAAKSPPLWGGRQLVLVWRTERYKAQDLAGLEAYLRAPSPHTCLIFIAPGLKPRDVQAQALWRQLQAEEAALAFPRLREGELPQWLEREARHQGKTLGPGAARTLIEATGSNLFDLYQELQKLVLYVGAAATITAADAARLGSQSRTRTIFELVEALGENRPDKAFKVLDRLLALGEPPARILVMLARQLRLLIRTREGLQNRLGALQLAQELGVPKMVAEKLLRQAGGFRRSQLQKQLIRLHEADQSIKTGMGAPRLLLERVILDLCPAPALRHPPPER